MNKPHMEALVAFGAIAASPDWMAIQEKAQAAVNAVYELREYVIVQQRALDAARARIKELEDRLFAIGEMRNAPCFCCGYNGHDYYNPEVHACAARHHAALSAKGE